MRDSATRLLARFTYANVMSTFAVFLLLTGGAAYAANTIRSTDIVNGEVKGADIAADAISNTKIAADQVYSGDVRDDDLPGGGLQARDLAAGSVGHSEIADGSVTQDDLGSNSVGYAEIQNGALPQFAFDTQNSTALDTTTTKEVVVSCGAGYAVTGGGYVADGALVSVVRSYAVSASAWLVRAIAISGTPTWQLTAVANCVA